MLPTIAAMFLVCFGIASTVFAEDGFVSLMPPEGTAPWTEDAQPHAGWVKYGGEATFEMDGDVIVANRGPGYSTFLCTEKRYRNFILKFETAFDVGMNSGMQFRSNIKPGKFEDKETGAVKDIHVVFGYQCESDPNPGHMSAFIFDESRRGWLNDDTPENHAKSDAAFQKGAWNEYTIQCIGPSIKTWLNGQLIADFVDTETEEGFFGLQMHSGKQGKIRWRNIRVKELPDTPWVTLYADKEFGPVEAKPAGTWAIQEDGSVLATTPEGEKRDGLLLSKDSYKNFASRVSFKKVSGNSGLYFRAAEVDKSYWLKGFQCEIENGPPCAGLWEVEGRGWVAKDEEPAKKFYKNNDWNTVSVVAVGDHLVTFLNGRKIVDIVDPQCAKEGKTGLQLHGGGNQGFYFRDYEIMPLDDDAVKRIEN